MKPTPILAKDIEHAIEILNELMDKSINDVSRSGYFTALYAMVTIAVRDAIKEEVFEDNERMHKLDVIFANYFFKNLNTHNLVWDSYFSANHATQYVIMQHLLLGMNAHINYDLAQAVIDTQSSNLENLHADYLQINAILNEQLDIIQDKLSKTSFFLRILDIIGLGFDEAYSNFSMIKARDEAWDNAVKLSTMNEEERTIHLELMQTRTLEIADFIKKPTFFYKILTFINKVSEKRSVKFNLMALNPF